MRLYSQSGQILLIVVLTMIIALTVGLSIAARVVTELKLSRQNEESQRAFQAAEAGIQQALESKENINDAFENNASFTTTIVNDTGNTIFMNNGIEVDQDVGGDVWLSDYSPDQALLYGNPMGGGSTAVPITMYWGATNQTSCLPSGSSVAPAIEVVLLKGPLSDPKIQKSIYEANDDDCEIARINNTTRGTIPSSTPVPGVNFRNSAPLKFNGVDLQHGLIMKVIPLYNSTIIAFTSDSPPPNEYPFPSQGSIVDSTGESGETVRKVSYFQSHPQMPLEVFPYSIISQ